MSTTFSRSMRALHADRSRGSNRLLLLAVVLLLLWGAWFFFARVPLYESSDAARIEVDRASYPLQSPVAGKVVRAGLAMGAEVKPGDILVELDTETESHQIRELQSHLVGVGRQIDALRGEMAERRRGQSENGTAGSSALQEARDRYNEAEAAARFAEDQARRMTGLAAQGSISELEVGRFKSEAEERRAAADAGASALARVEKQQQIDRTDRQIDIEHLSQQIALLEGDAATTQESIDRLNQEIERHRIRAQVAGRLGEVAELKAGSVVAAGEKLGTIVPAGDLRVIASFSPSSVFGRIRPGQPALMRVAGFPWTQFGSLASVVKNVGSEVRDGGVRVELAIGANRGSAIPLQHGLPGSVDVEVERISPAALVLRTAGKLISPATDEGGTVAAGASAATSTEPK